MNNIDDLRTTLFDTLQGLKSGSVDIDRAKAICDVSQVIINTAKAETDYARATGAAVRSSFIEPGTSKPALPSASHQERTTNGTKIITPIAPGASVTVHKMRG